MANERTRVQAPEAHPAHPAHHAPEAHEWTPIEAIERELARAYRVERALREVGLALGKTLDLDALLRLILERTTEVLEAERATLYLIESRPIYGGGWEPVLVSRVIEGGAIGEIVLPVGAGIAGDVARTGRVANVRDAYDDPRFSRTWDDKSGFRTRSVLCVPLRSQTGEIIGVIQVLNKLRHDSPDARTTSRSDPPPAPDSVDSLFQADLPSVGSFERAIRLESDRHPVALAADGAYFDDDDEALLAALAAQAAVSIEQARLVASILDKNRELSIARTALEKKVQDLNVLFAIERATARSTGREELALAILPEAARSAQARTAHIVLADESGDLQLFHIGTDAAEASPPDSLAPPSRSSSRPSPAPTSVFPRRLGKLRVKAGEGLVGDAIATGRTIVVADVSADPRSSERLRPVLFPGGEDIKAPSAIVPLFEEHDRAFGALVVLRKTGDRPFSEDDVDLLRLIALNVSTGFQLEAARTARARQDRLSTIGSLLSGVMHDLKTPLTVISGYVQLMSSSDDPVTRAEFADLVLRQVDHIGAMQKEVLELARGERTILMRRVYLSPFFQEIESQIGQEVRRRGNPVDLQVDVRDRGTARFDEAKVTRAIHNLARNALEAMGERGGRLGIAVDRAPGDVITISVTDTGPGIPPEVEGRLFESFVTAGKPTGTGLGLAIVKKIAEDHGGSIDARSSPLGARFTLRLPQQRP